MFWLWKEMTKSSLSIRAIEDPKPEYEVQMQLNYGHQILLSDC